MFDLKNLDKKQVLKYSAIVLIPIIIIISIVFYSMLRDPDFYVSDISTEFKQKMIDEKQWQDGCPLPLDRMKIINIKYHAEDNKIKRDGKFIVLDAISDNSIKLFKDLFKKGIVIEKINYADTYSNHRNSILDNNSLAFICDLDEKNKGFLYSYGLAFDINPLYNPTLIYKNSTEDVITEITAFSKSAKYVNRNINFKMKNEPFVEIFRKHGFSEWGGNWNVDVNWQYFSVNPVVANIMLSMPKDDSIEFFQIIVDNIKFIDRFDKSEFATEIRDLYQKDGVKFLKILKKNFSKLKNLSDSQFFDFLRKKINNE